jgi:hypothetical protein
MNDLYAWTMLYCVRQFLTHVIWSCRLACIGQLMTHGFWTCFCDLLAGCCSRDVIIIVITFCATSHDGFWTCFVYSVNGWILDLLCLIS